MLFDLEQTKVQINGHNVTGFSDDGDALSLPTIDIATVKRGADGIMTGASTGEKGGPVIFKLLPNSVSTKFFMNLVASIQGGGRVTFDGIVNDEANGIVVKLERGLLTSAPTGPTIGKGDVANMEFTIEFERITPDYSGANFTTRPVGG